MRNSDVLVVGHPRPESLDFGADFAGSFTDARTYLERHRPAVLVFGKTDDSAEWEAFCTFVLEKSPDSLWILSGDGLPASELIRWNNAGRLHDVIDSLEDPDLQSKLHSALESTGEHLQRRKLVELFEEQSQRLTRLSSDLEARVRRRHKTLRHSLRRLEETKTRMQAFHRALLGIHRASTILQMEQTLNEALNGTIDVEWVRVRFASQSWLGTRQTGSHVLCVQLPLLFEKSRGEVMFAKAEGKRFAAGETDFLQELSEALGLALSRLQKLEQAETLKGQWQATFDSIPHALCLTAGEYEILKLNSAFQQACAAKGTFHSLIGKKCFPVFFGSEFEPPARLEAPFTFRAPRTLGDGDVEHFEVTGQRLGLTHDNHSVQLVLLRPVTEEVRFERRILEASKLAELGTIGSSIAHELNNPLGGMLSFLQLILMDINKINPIYNEIKAMEEATLRCRDIVQNLLSFARKQDLSDMTAVDLWEIAIRAVKVTELQSKSQGIRVEFERGPACPVLASANALSQALCNLLQNSIDAINDKMKKYPFYAGQIRVVISEDSKQGKYFLSVSDNGTGILPEVRPRIFNPLFTTRNPAVYGGMGLTTAHTIVTEHHGSLEILSRTGSGTEAIIALPRLDDSPD